LYVPWCPCTDCARGIIQTGISDVIVHKNGQDFYDQHTNGKWADSNRRTMDMFAEAGVKYKLVECNVVVPEIYMNGKHHDAVVYLNNQNKL
jgi:deoxycytidylate deaminase